MLKNGAAPPGNFPWYRKYRRHLAKCSRCPYGYRFTFRAVAFVCPLQCQHRLCDSRLSACSAVDELRLLLPLTRSGSRHFDELIVPIGRNLRCGEMPGVARHIGPSLGSCRVVEAPHVAARACEKFSLYRRVVVHALSGAPSAQHDGAGASRSARFGEGQISRRSRLPSSCTAAGAGSQKLPE